VGVSGNPCAVHRVNFKFAHNIETFSFKTPGAGSYNWPVLRAVCAGYLFGNGGAMSTQNYMGGELEVVN